MSSRLDNISAEVESIVQSREKKIVHRDVQRQARKRAAAEQVKKEKSLIEQSRDSGKSAWNTALSSVISFFTR